MARERPQEVSTVSSAERRLCVFFEAGVTRYAVEAISVLEVARPERDDETLRGHHGIRDLSTLLGGEPEQRPGTVVVLDSSPTLAVRTRKVDGVFDAAPHLVLPVPNRLVPLLAPAVKQGLVSDQALVFELDAANVARGLPRPTRRLEVVAGTATGPCLVFETMGKPFAVSLERTSSVASSGPMFNPAPGVGSFIGVLMHQQRLVPAFTLVEGACEALLVVIELSSGPVAVSASRAIGVRPASALGGAVVLDAALTFA